MKMENKKGLTIPEMIGALLITIIIVIVAVSIIFMWFGGFISPEDNAKQTAMNMAEGIKDVWGGPFFCKEVDVAIFPNYQLYTDYEDKDIVIVQKSTNEEGDVTYEEVSRYSYGDTDYKVCSPLYFDKSAHTTHCDAKLSININWDDKIVGKYCICKDDWFYKKIFVYPKKIGAIECILTEAIAQKTGETISSAAEEKIEEHQNKLKKAIKDGEEAEEEEGETEE